MNEGTSSALGKAATALQFATVGAVIAGASASLVLAAAMTTVLWGSRRRSDTGRRP